MFLLIAVGMGVRKGKLLLPGEVRKVNQFIYNVFFPPLMFNNIYSTELGGSIHKRLLFFAVVMVLAIFSVSIPIVMKLEKDNRRRGVLVQAAYRGNLIIMGLPVVTNLYGKKEVGVATVILAVIVPIYNILAVIILEVFRGSKVDPVRILKGLARNPIILGAAAGIIVSALHIKLPFVIEQPVRSMGEACTPIALVILGASFRFESVSDSGRQLFAGVFIRLLLTPCIGLTISALTGFRGYEFVILLIVFAAPAALSSFTMSEAMDADGELAGNIVIFSSALSVFTLFFWLFLFRTMGIF